MNLNLYDNIKLNTEIEELGNRGIHKNCMGTIAKLGTEKSLIVFYNRKDIGDYAFAWVENIYLDYIEKLDEELIKEFAERVAKLAPAEKLCFEECNLQEYDTVELIVEKSKYAKLGAHRGMIGTILDPEKIDGSWLIYFADEIGADTIGIPIKEKDLKLIHRSEN